jgi:hypothetical protein
MKPAVKILLALAAAAVLLVAAGMVKFNLLRGDTYLAGSAVTAAELQGSWVSPVAGQPGQEEGFELRAGGAAALVNLRFSVHDILV